MQWVVQKFANKDYGKIRSVLLSLGQDVVDIIYVPTVLKRLEHLDIRGTIGDGPVVVLSNLGVAGLFSREKRFTPGVWLDLDGFRCSSYYSALSRYILQDDYVMMPVFDIINRSDRVFGYFGGDRVFIRPDGNDKVFNGQVVFKDNFSEWFYSLGVGDDTLAVISGYKVVDVEWRVVVVDGVAVGGSQYMVMGEINISSGVPGGVLRFAELVFGLYDLHRVMCVDVGLFNGEYRVVEISSINTSGLYDCDLESIFRGVIRVAVEEFEQSKIGNG